MKHTFLYLVLSLFIFGCGNNKKKANTDKSETVEATSTKTSKIGNENYSIVWNWTTKDEQLVSDNSPTISKELTALWQKGIVENAYYNSDSEIDKFLYFPNISFILKAESYDSAEIILNNLTIVKKGIAVYQIYPIGTLWLDRKIKTIHKNGLTKSFVTVWKTNKKPKNELTQAQNDKILELWNAGKIENVYFDIEGTQIVNRKTDFVFYVNSNTKEEAIALCESLPFFKENIASYQIYEVGVFWMGKFKE